MSADTWNPDQYARFRDERSRPFFELLDLVQPQPNMRVVDLGCGTGELTRLLHQRLQARETIGLDSSDAMLARARQQEGDGLRFVQQDITAFSQALAERAGTGETLSTRAGPTERFDLIFSNAALQWVDGHPALIERLAAGLAPGGQLAVQVPANGDHASHLAASDVAREEPFRTALQGHVRIFPILPPEGYASLLDRLGFREQHVRLQVFGHHLGGREDVIEWVKGTLLTDYQKRLTPDLYAAFLERYRAVLLPRLEDTRPYFYPFKRILFWAKKV